MLYAFGITAGCHRLWAHKSYEAKTPLKILLMFLNSGILKIVNLKVPSKEASGIGAAITDCTINSQIQSSIRIPWKGAFSFPTLDGFSLKKTLYWSARG
jgi:hypothetical protein